VAMEASRCRIENFYRFGLSVSDQAVLSPRLARKFALRV
jgi:hypothetical protein